MLLVKNYFGEVCWSGTPFREEFFGHGCWHGSVFARKLFGEGVLAWPHSHENAICGHDIFLARDVLILTSFSPKKPCANIIPTRNLFGHQPCVDVFLARSLLILFSQECPGWSPADIASSSRLTFAAYITLAMESSLVPFSWGRKLLTSFKRGHRLLTSFHDEVINWCLSRQSHLLTL